MSRPAVTTAVEAVAGELRARILAGDLAPGERLREEELSTRYDVARHTARAAVRQLAAERLVRVEPHRGARVAALDGTALAALFELRAALEVEAVRLLAERRGLDPWPPEVAAAAEELQDACRAGARARIDEAHAALHHTLVAAAGSPRITEAHAALELESRVVLLQSRPGLPPDRMADMHRRLLQDLRTEGTDAVRRHLHAGAAAVWHPRDGAAGQDDGVDPA